MTKPSAKTAGRCKEPSLSSSLSAVASATAEVGKGRKEIPLKRFSAHMERRIPKPQGCIPSPPLEERVRERRPLFSGLCRRFVWSDVASQFSLLNLHRKTHWFFRSTPCTLSEGFSECRGETRFRSG